MSEVQVKEAEVVTDMSHQWGNQQNENATKYLKAGAEPHTARLHY